MIGISYALEKLQIDSKEESFWNKYQYCLIFLTIYFEIKENILFSPGPMLFDEKLEFDFQFKINS